MKFRGERIEGPSSKILVFPREGRKPIKLEIVAVLDSAPFDELVPDPIPPTMIKRGGEKVPNFDDKNYQKLVARRGALYSLWINIQSLYCPAETQDEQRVPVEWEKVDPTNPSTWNLFDEELKDAGLSQFERFRISREIVEVNSLSEGRLAEARDSFLASRQAPIAPSTSPEGEKENTSSGEPASDSE